MAQLNGRANANVSECIQDTRECRTKREKITKGEKVPRGAEAEAETEAAAGKGERRGVWTPSRHHDHYNTKPHLASVAGVVVGRGSFWQGNQRETKQG